MRRLWPIAALLLAALLTAPSFADANVPGTKAVPASCAQTPAPGDARCFADVLVSTATGEPLDYPATPPATAFGPATLENVYGFPGPTSMAGAGSTIAIVDAFDDPTAAADLATYRTQYGLPACAYGTVAGSCLRIVDQRGLSDPTAPTWPDPPDPGTDADWTLEISLDLDLASAACPACHILLVEADSAGLDDLAAGVQAAVDLGATVVSNSYGTPEGGTGLDTLAPTYSASGVAMVAAAGDGGYAAGPQFPADLASVTAVGATNLTLSDSGARSIEQVWSGSGGGCSTLTVPAAQNQLAWQNAGCAHRLISDVSVLGDPNTPFAIYDNNGLTFPDPNVSPRATYTNDGWSPAGGTSASAPIIAGYYAIVGGQAGVGGPAWAYQTASSNPAAFVDITMGSNGPCGGDPTNPLCNAVVGYDGPSGIGVPDLTHTTRVPDTSPVSESTTQGHTTLSGTVATNGSATTYHLEYGPTIAYGTSTSGAELAAGADPAVAAPVDGLSAGAYHARIVATNATGTRTGPDATFTITADELAPPPANTPAPSPAAPLAQTAVVPALHLALGSATKVYAKGVKRTFGASGLTLSGTVVDQTGRAVAGVKVALSIRVGRAGAFLAAKAVKTDAAGRWKIVVGKGSSRSLRLSATATGATEAKTVTIAETVAPDVTAKVTRFSRTRATVSGTLSVAALPITGRVVSVQVRRGTTWQKIATVRATAKGSWSVRIPAPRGRRLEVRAAVAETTRTASAQSAVVRLAA